MVDGPETEDGAVVAPLEIGGVHTATPDSPMVDSVDTIPNVRQPSPGSRTRATRASTAVTTAARGSPRTRASVDPRDQAILDVEDHLAAMDL